ncbi:hypothetical protein [Candidatus Electronema sp. PJ]|jgi:hypothetical protein|uniref:hypothetical protein n=1 Tax=Candidatus Electronema sp. PJ TaxID=3401572 RepID=UPI003AA7E32C
MHAITFETIAHNGMINIPQQYQQLFTEDVQVTVWVKTLKKEAVINTDFRAISVASKEFTFNRDEANGR